MKDHVNRLARGEFIFDMPDMSVSEADIEKNIGIDESSSFSFGITGSSEIKGVVYSTDYRVTVNNSNFIGVENIIYYNIDTTGVLPDEVIKGNFHIISNAGESSLPYSFRVTERTVETTMGHVHNLFHFANLAQMAPEEAQIIYRTPEFCDIFVKNNIELVNIYSVLYKNPDIRESIEEFLVAVNKKNPVRFTFSEENASYGNVAENFKDSITIQKNTWGYSRLFVSCDVEFVSLQTLEEFDTEVFSGTRFELEYIIDRTKMHPGKNYACITVITSEQKLFFTIEAEKYNTPDNEIKNKDSISDNKERKRAIYKLLKLYLAFRTKSIDMKLWLDESDKILNRIRGILSKDAFFKIVQAQIWITRQKADNGKWLLESVRDEVLENIEGNVALYCYYLYVNSLLEKSQEYSAEVFAIIKKYFDNGHDEWQLLWMMFYLDEESDRNQSIKLARIKDQFHRGCKSPVMYLEACNIINQQPMLLRVLNDFELQVISFAARYNLIFDGFAEQICEISKNEKSMSKTFLKILRKVYDIYRNDDMLYVLCTNLIRNEISGPEVFDIYEKCIQKNFRITKLYEYYMDSVDETRPVQLPKMALLYFAYNNQLEYDKKAFLYSCIINNKDKDNDTYFSYTKQIELFAIDMLRKGRISENLVTVYRDVWDRSLINEDTVETVSKLMFTYKIKIEKEGIKAVVVKHKECLKEIVYPVFDGVAYVQMYTDNCAVVYLDNNGKRSLKSAKDQTIRLFDDITHIHKVYDVNSYDLFLSLYLSEMNLKYKKRTGDSLRIQNFLFTAPEVSNAFKKELRHSMILYYFHDYTGDEFRQRFSDINREGLTESESTMLIECCAINGMYEEAYELAILYGYRKVNPKRMFRLCRRMIEITNYMENEILTGMCHIAFINKKYDDSILEYLVENFNGTTHEMYEICEACNNFSVEAYDIEERLISQMLFINEGGKRLDRIFERYYMRGARERIVEAYLSFNSYNYFVKKMNVSQDVFRIIENMLVHDFEGGALSWKIALLKYYSTIESTDERQKDLGAKIIAELCRNKRIFAFYKDLEGKVPVPCIAFDKTVIEYRTNPDNKVVLNYLLTDRDLRDSRERRPYVRETMRNTFEGVFTKEFTLMYGDELEYYFTEINNGIETSTDSRKISCNQINLSGTYGRYEHVNDMLASRELHDMVTLKKLMRGYCVEDYVTQQLFRPF